MCIRDRYQRRVRENYAKLRSSFLDEYSKHPDAFPKVPAKGSAPAKNLIELVNDEDYDMVDHRQALRIPPMVLKELRDAVEREAQRRCYDAEKTMARCVQDKMWTRWKCQKDRDEYYRCLRGVREDNDILTQLRWKYNLGTFHGEIVARKLIMQRLWMDHFPDREIPHGSVSYTHLRAHETPEHLVCRLLLEKKKKKNNGKHTKTIKEIIHEVVIK
eukprot:TRINITY_DN64106_c0_g1_i2.p1 TRINITY_DN64106_c0_g1~~TRINITY_DN64106_c0_g1_i2.p1  ORF type:complete len:216 (+),score=58.53 TRINITY_DN64106_c0_g1_i2:163-810(+)